MATIEELQKAAKLVRIDVPLEDGQLPDRQFYGTPEFVKWLNDELPKLASNWNLDEDPAQQMDNLLAEFISGGPLEYDRRFKPWDKASEPGVWYLKTADLRIFGWFPRKDCFIATHADTAQRIKDHGLYAGYVGSVVRSRDALPLDEPKFINGANPDDVVSIQA